MGRLLKLEFQDLPELRVIGKSIRPKMDMTENPIPAFWKQCFSDGTMDGLNALSEFHHDPSYIGWMGEWSCGDGLFTYMVGLLTKPGTAVPEGYEYRDLTPTQVALGWIQGPESEVYSGAHELTIAGMKEHDYVMNEDHNWCMELYNCPRFTQADENGEIILDYYIPIRQGE